MKENLNTEKLLAEYKKLIRERLNKYLEKRQPEKLWEAIRYSVLSEGKMLRPVLVLESARVCGGEYENVLPVACALEMLHVQSLIHDDLPSMDNDDFRRGKPSCHKAFGEAEAVLAGDALLAYAPFCIIEHTPKSADKKVLMNVLSEFLNSAGPSGIVGGQFVDIEAENNYIDISTFDYIIRHKTATLFKFAMRAGAMLSSAENDILEALSFYGETVGYAFQIADDILDEEGTLEELGKTPGKDKKFNKNTYVSIYGIDKSRKKLENLCISAKKILDEKNIKSELLFKIADNIVNKAIKC